MDFNKLTIKSQEAVAAAQDIARRRGNPELTPDHLLLALLDQELFADWGGLRAEAEQKLDKLATRPGRAAAADRVRRVLTRARRGRGRAAQARGRLHLDRASLPRARAGAARRDPRVDREGARRAARHLAGPGGELPGAEQVRPRPHGGGGGGQARPGDRPRRGDPPRHADPLAPHEEQPGADRRAGRRQDGDRRRASRSGSLPATCRKGCATAACGRSTSARCSQARSTAASSRSA